MSLFIMEKTTRGPHSEEKNIEICKILKFGVNQVNIEQDTLVKNLKNLLRDNGLLDTLSSGSWYIFEFFKWLYLIQYRTEQHQT